MPLITSGANATIAVAANQILTVIAHGGEYTFENPVGTRVVDSGSSNVFGPFAAAGTVKLSSVQGDLYYEVAAGQAVSSGVQFSFDSSANVSGLVSPSGRPLGFAPANVNIDPRNFGAGATLVNMATATVTGATGVTKVTNQPFTTLSGSSIKFSLAGAGAEVVDLGGSFPITAANQWVGFWAQRTGALGNAAGFTPIPFTVYFTANGFSTFSTVNLTIYPGLHYYVFPLPNAANSFQAFNGSFSIPSTATTIRIRASNGGNGAVQYPSAISGDAVYFGDIEIDPPKPKARFIICFDDCKIDLVNPGGTAIVDGKGNTAIHSYLSFVQSYGFPVSAFLVTGAINNYALNYMSAYQISKMRDEQGVALAAHSHTHAGSIDNAAFASSTGLRVLGQYGFNAVGAVQQTAGATGVTYTPTTGYTGILADLNQSHDILNRMGFKEATKYFALPQGGYDWYVNQAVEQMGYKLVRGVQNQVSHPYGHNTFSPGNGQECCSALSIVMSSLQSDIPSMSQAAIQATIDYIIATGATGSNYCHNFAGSLATRTQMKYLCDYLAIKKAAGLIDVISIYEM